MEKVSEDSVLQAMQAFAMMKMEQSEQISEEVEDVDTLAEKVYEDLISTKPSWGSIFDEEMKSLIIANSIAEFNAQKGE